MTPTQRTLAAYRKAGWTAEVVERWNAHARIRQDLLGCIDIVALSPGRTLGIQATSGTNVAARLTKSLALPKLREWLRAGNYFVVVGWRKAGPRGRRKTWQMRSVRVYLLGDKLMTEEEGCI